MASSSGGNYYALLDSEESNSAPKRKKNAGSSFNIQNEHDFPNLTSINTTIKKSCPKFIVIKNKNAEIPLNKLNIFLVSKALESISSEKPKKISFTRDGDLLILTNSESQTKKFLKATQLSNLCQISTSLHPTLNTVKGVIFAPPLKELSEAEILEGLKDQAVVGCKKITKFVDGKAINTSLHIISFDAFEIPKELKIGFLIFKVDPYIPSPLQCKNCFKLGHTKKYCKTEQKCEVCASSQHDPVPCTRVQCINCNGEHSSNNKNCPYIKKNQEVIKVKCTNNCSYKEALKTVNETINFNFPTPIEPLNEAIKMRQKRINDRNNNNNNPSTSAVSSAPTKNTATEKSSSPVNHSITTLNNNKYYSTPKSSLPSQSSATDNIPPLPEENYDML